MKKLWKKRLLAVLISGLFLFSGAVAIVGGALGSDEPIGEAPEAPAPVVTPSDVEQEPTLEPDPEPEPDAATEGDGDGAQLFSTEPGPQEPSEPAPPSEPSIPSEPSAPGNSDTENTQPENTRAPQGSPPITPTGASLNVLSPNLKLEDNASTLLAGQTGMAVIGAGFSGTEAQLTDVEFIIQAGTPLALSLPNTNTPGLTVLSESSQEIHVKLDKVENSGQLDSLFSVQYRFPNGTTPDGQKADIYIAELRRDGQALPMASFDPSLIVSHEITNQGTDSWSAAISQNSAGTLAVPADTTVAAGGLLSLNNARSFTLKLSSGMQDGATPGYAYTQEVSYKATLTYGDKYTLTTDDAIAIRNNPTSNAFFTIEEADGLEMGVEAEVSGQTVNFTFTATAGNPLPPAERLVKLTPVVTLGHVRLKDAITYETEFNSYNTASFGYRITAKTVEGSFDVLSTTTTTGAFTGGGEVTFNFSKSQYSADGILRDYAASVGKTTVPYDYDATTGAPNHGIFTGPSNAVRNWIAEKPLAIDAKADQIWFSFGLPKTPNLAIDTLTITDDGYNPNELTPLAFYPGYAEITNPGFVAPTIIVQYSGGTSATVYNKGTPDFMYVDPVTTTSVGTFYQLKSTANVTGFSIVYENLPANHSFGTFEMPWVLFGVSSSYTAAPTPYEIFENKATITAKAGAYSGTGEAWSEVVCYRDGAEGFFVNKEYVVQGRPGSTPVAGDTLEYTITFQLDIGDNVENLWIRDEYTPNLFPNDDYTIRITQKNGSTILYEGNHLPTTSTDPKYIEYSGVAATVEGAGYREFHFSGGVLRRGDVVTIQYTMQIDPGANYLDTFKNVVEYISFNNGNEPGNGGSGSWKPGGTSGGTVDKDVVTAYTEIQVTDAYGDTPASYPNSGVQYFPQNAGLLVEVEGGLPYSALGTKDPTFIVNDSNNTGAFELGELVSAYRYKADRLTGDMVDGPYDIDLNTVKVTYFDKDGNPNPAASSIVFVAFEGITLAPDEFIHFTLQAKAVNAVGITLRSTLLGGEVFADDMVPATVTPWEKCYQIKCSTGGNDKEKAYYYLLQRYVNERGITDPLGSLVTGVYKETAITIRNRHDEGLAINKLAVGSNGHEISVVKQGDEILYKVFAKNRNPNSQTGQYTGHSITLYQMVDVLPQGQEVDTTKIAVYFEEIYHHTPQVPLDASKYTVEPITYVNGGTQQRLVITFPGGIELKPTDLLQVQYLADVTDITAAPGFDDTGLATVTNTASFYVKDYVRGYKNDTLLDREAKQTSGLAAELWWNGLNVPENYERIQATLDMDYQEYAILPQIQKKLDNSSTTVPNLVNGVEIPWEITVTNGAAAHSPMKGFTVVDVLPAGFTYHPGSANPTPAAELVNTAGQTVLVWKFDFLAPGDSQTITYKSWNSSMVLGWRENQAVVLPAELFSPRPYTVQGGIGAHIGEGTLDGGNWLGGTGLAHGHGVVDSAEVTLTSHMDVASGLTVKAGADDSALNGNTDNSITAPRGETVTYTYTVENNSGSYAFDGIELYATLPAVGDEYVLINGSRLSAWDMEWLANPNATLKIGGVDVGFTIEYTDYTPQQANRMNEWRNVATWTPAPDASTTAFRIIADSKTLDMGQELVFTWEMRVPTDVPYELGGQKAWESMAFFMQYISGQTYSYFAEPNRAGVALPEMPKYELEVEKIVVDTTQSPIASSSFTFQLSYANGFNLALEEGVHTISGGTINVDGTFSITAGPVTSVTATIGGLYAGDYTVQELVPAGYTVDNEQQAFTLPKGDGTLNHLVFTNTRDEDPGPGVPPVPEKDVSVFDGEGNRTGGNKDEAQVGDFLVYTVSFTNTHTYALDKVTLTDEIPANTAYTGISTPAATLDTGVLAWTFDNVGAGETRTATFTVEVLASAENTTIYNTAYMQIGDNGPLVATERMENPVPEKEQPPTSSSSTPSTPGGSSSTPTGSSSSVPPSSSETPSGSSSVPPASSSSVPPASSSSTPLPSSSTPPPTTTPPAPEPGSSSTPSSSSRPAVTSSSSTPGSSSSSSSPVTTSAAPPPEPAVSVPPETSGGGGTTPPPTDPGATSTPTRDDIISETGSFRVFNTEVPIGSFGTGVGWSLLNLMLSLIALFTGVIMMVTTTVRNARRRRAAETGADEGTEREMVLNPETGEYVYGEPAPQQEPRRNVKRMVAIASALLPLLLFLILENLVFVVFVTRWTPLIVASFVLFVICMIIAKAPWKKKDEEQQAEETTE